MVCISPGGASEYGEMTVEGIQTLQTMEIVIAEDEGNRRNSALSTWWGDGGPDEQEVLFGMACAWTLRLFQHANSEAVGCVLW